MSIDSGIFPNRLKEAQVTPIFKKNDPSLKGNYRPVSILPIPSTNFEKVLSVQFSDFFDNIFDHFLCAFRKGHGCQTTLLRLLEDWKQALDCKEYIVAILMDLSKAFDCLPHDILICKLSTYGLSDNATKLLLSYLYKTERHNITEILLKVALNAINHTPNLVVKYKILTESAFKTGRKEIPLQAFLTCFAASSNKLYLPTMYAYRVYPAMSKSPKTTTKLSGYSRNKSRSNLCQLPVYRSNLCQLPVYRSNLCQLPVYRSNLCQLPVYPLSSPPLYCYHF
jgi:hypothetical protein